MSADAFATRFDPPIGDGIGPLASLRLAVKDNFDIAGHVTGAGNPEWADTHNPAQDTAPLVSHLIKLGTHLVGKTQMDELAYSLMGQNARYGTPENPAGPGRVPGGSSSGSASAVAAGLADIGLGTDTGGSVRIPAAFCGLWGWRPTHGLLDARGLLPLAPSYDVPGFMTRDGATLQHLAELLAPEAAPPRGEQRVPADMWDFADAETLSALAPLRQGDPAPLLSLRLREALLPTFRVCQGAEVAQVFGAWIKEHEPAFGPGVRERFAGAMALAPQDISAAQSMRAEITGAIDAAQNGGIIRVPTAPGPAPLLTLDGQGMEAYRNRALTLLCLSGHAGLPQVTIPLRSATGLPIGLSLIGPRGSDAALIAMAVDMAKSTR